MNFIYLLNSQSIIHRQSESQNLNLVDCSLALLTSGMISSMSPLMMISSISSGFLLISPMMMILLIVLFISILLLLPFAQMTELAHSVALSLQVRDLALRPLAKHSLTSRASNSRKYLYPLQPRSQHRAP